MKRILMRIFGWLALGVPVLILAALTGLQVFLATDTAGRMIRERINAAIPGRVTWEAQSVSVFRGQARILGLRMLAPDGRPCITAEALSANISLTDLLFGRISVESIGIQKPAVLLDLDPQGRLNVSSAMGLSPAGGTRRPAEESARMPRVRVQRLNLESGRFTFHAAEPEPGQTRTRVELQDIGFTVSDADLRQRSGKIRLSIASGRVAASKIRLPIQNFRLTAALRRGRVAPLNLELHAAGSRVKISGGVENVFRAPRMKDVNLLLTADLAGIRRVLDLDTALDGTVQVNAAASGTPSDPEVSVALDYTGGRVAGLKIQDLRMDAGMQNRKVDLKRLDAGLAGGRIESAGTVDLRSAFANGFTAAPVDPEAIAYQLRLRTQEIQLSAMPGTAGVSGRLSGPLTLEGSGISTGVLGLRINADLRAERLVLAPSAAPLDLQGRFRAELAGKKLVLERANVASADFDVNTAGSWDISENRLDLLVSATVPRIEALAARLGAAGITGGAANLRARVFGPAALPDVTADLAVRNPRFGKTAVEKIDAEISFSDGRLDLTPLEITDGGSAFAISGGIRLLAAQTGKPLADPALDLSIRQSTLFLQDFLPAVSGQIRISGNIGGTVQNLQGVLTADGRDIDTGIQPIPAASLNARLDGRRIHMEPLEITLAREQSLVARGWVSLDQLYSLRIESEPIALERLKFLDQTGLSGRLTIGAQGRGRLPDPALQARIEVADVRSGGRPLPDVALTAELQGMKARAQIQDPVPAGLSYDLAGGDFSASAEFSDTDLALFSEIAGYPEVTGRISGTLEANGNVFKPEKIQTRLSVSGLRVMYGGRELAAARNFSASLKNGEIVIPGSRITLLEEGFVEIRGTGNLERNLDITARGAVPAGLARDLVPAIASPEGRISLSARIRGTINQPDIFAEIGLSDLGWVFPQTDQQMHSVNGKIRVENQGITISGGSGRVEAGSFTLNGEIGIADYRPVRADLEITADSLPIRVPDTMDMKLNGNLKLAGTPEEAALAGDIVLLEGLYYRDVNLNLLQIAGEIGQRRRQTPQAPQMPALDIPFFKQLGLEVSIGHRRPFVMDNNLALLDIRPQLRLGGTAANPRLTGRAEITEGTVSYRKTEFTVEKGIIDFVNPYRIEPTVDIRAESRVRQWTITLLITGTPDNLDFRLSSSPPESDADILSLLAVGKTTRELGESGGGPSPEAMLANLVGGRLEKQVKAGTGLDIVELEYQKDGTGSQEMGDVRLTVGKQLSRRLTVKYGVAHKGGEMVRQSTGVYKLTKDVSVNAFQDSAGAFGGEMRYRLEFR